MSMSAESAVHWKASMEAMQVAVYVMCGGGMLGSFAAEQPADFYIDARVGRLPFKVKEIEEAVMDLVAVAKARGCDPHRMPRMPSIPNMGVF